MGNEQSGYGRRKDNQERQDSSEMQRLPTMEDEMYRLQERAVSPCQFSKMNILHTTPVNTTAAKASLTGSLNGASDQLAESGKRNA